MALVDNLGSAIIVKSAPKHRTEVREVTHLVDTENNIYLSRAGEKSTLHDQKNVLVGCIHQLPMNVQLSSSHIKGHQARKKYQVWCLDPSGLYLKGLKQAF